MKTSSKLLIGFFTSILVAISIMMAVARYKTEDTLQGNGIKMVENRPLANFNAIDLSGDADIILTQGREFNFEIKGDQNLLSKANSEVNDSVLVIKLPNNRKHPRFEILVSAPAFKSIALSRGVKLKTNNTIQGDVLHLSMHTGSTGDLDIAVKNFDFVSSTGSTVKLKGKADIASFKASTGSVVDALDFPIDDCSVDGSTGVQLEINAIKQLGIVLSTGSSLKYKGKPIITNIKNSMGGSVEKLD